MWSPGLTHKPSPAREPPQGEKKRIWVDIWTDMDSKEPNDGNFRTILTLKCIPRRALW